MSINLDWGNSVKEFERTVDKTNKTIQKEIQKILKKTVDEIVREVKRMTPSKSGKLRRNWRSRKMNKKSYSYLIENNVQYASFVENGTRTVVPVKMLRNSMEKGTKRLEKRLQVLGKKLERTF